MKQSTFDSVIADGKLSLCAVSPLTHRPYLCASDSATVSFQFALRETARFSFGSHDGSAQEAEKGRFAWSSTIPHSSHDPQEHCT